MDDMDIPITLPKAAEVFERDYNITVSRMTIWRWATGGSKRPYPCKLDSFYPDGFSRKLKTTRAAIHNYAVKRGWDRR